MDGHWQKSFANGIIQKQGCTNFAELQEAPQNSRCQKAGIKQVLHLGHTNNRYHFTKFSHPIDLVHRIGAPLFSRMLCHGYQHPKQAVLVPAGCQASSSDSKQWR